MSVAEERLLSLWPRRMVADFRGLEADEALLRNASAYTLALTLGAFPALLMLLPAATQTSVATVALTLPKPGHHHRVGCAAAPASSIPTAALATVASATTLAG